MASTDRNLLCQSIHEPRVPQRPAFVSSAGNPDSFIVGATNPGVLFFGYFLLHKQKKVTSCRATPDLQYSNAAVGCYVAPTLR